MRKNTGARYITGILAGFVRLLLIRYQFLAGISSAFWHCLPSLYTKKTIRTGYILTGFSYPGSLIFLASLFLRPPFSFHRPIQQTQESFFALTEIPGTPWTVLNPGPVSFLKMLPQATANSVLRPYPWEGKNLLQSFSSIDVLFLIAGVLFFMVSPRRRAQVAHPLYWLFLFYGISQMILIGIHGSLSGCHRPVPLYPAAFCCWFCFYMPVIRSCNRNFGIGFSNYIRIIHNVNFLMYFE